jgi:transposase-like protein
LPLCPPATIPHLTRSSLHRLFQRYEISRLPAIECETGRKKAFKRYPIGYFHIDNAEVRTEEGKLHLFVAIDRTSKFAFAQLHEKANRHTATAFLKALIAVVPYKIHTILTDAITPAKILLFFAPGTRIGFGLSGWPRHSHKT